MINDQKASINQIPLKMVEIKIKALNDSLILVNQKEVRKDMDGTWTTNESISAAEARFFNEFVDSLNRVNTKRMEATYKI